MEELLLTKNDHMNYIAICNVYYDRKVKKGGRRPGNHTLSPSRKLKLLQEQNYCCHDCGKEFRLDKNRKWSKATTEHVIPYIYGGTLNTHNVILLCNSCNNHKRNKKELLMDLIEAHYGPIDKSMLQNIPVVQFK